ncbi:DNRLRE domain-containing protein [Nonomuraea rubra]|uniref:DNRLRE domain-containing protein n=1 Tax=Nonomuraea rubra TaxID=46180 RepID=UPI0033DDD407
MTELSDQASALAAARAQNSRVLVTGETTESSLTYANPDGTLTTELVSGVARVKQGGRWTPVDTTLVEQNGVLKPRAAKAFVEFSAGGQDAPLAKLTRDDARSFALSWPSPLPRPRLEGNKAVYENAAGPDADLVVTALPTGFRHDVLLRSKPAGPVEYRLPVIADGLELATTEQGGLKLTDKAGKTVASAPQPIMWDSSAPTAGGRSASAETGSTPGRLGAIDTEVRAEGDQPVLVIRPDEEFLNAPGTRYPVTVDPTTTLGAQTDVTIGSLFPTNPNASAEYIGTGTSWTGSSSSPTRVEDMGLVKFDLAPLTGQSGLTVTDARLDLHGSGDSSCESAQGVTVQRVTSAWTSSVTWNTRPGTTTTGQYTVDDPHQCPPNSSERTWAWPITPIVQAWTTGTANHGLALRPKTVYTSGTRYYGASYHATEKTGTAFPPKLTVTYSVPQTSPDGNEGKERTHYWTRMLLEAYKEAGGAPGPLSRAGAMMYGAMYDAVHSIWGEGRPYLLNVQAGLQRYGAATTAIDHAAHTVLVSVWPQQKAFFDQALADAPQSSSTLPSAEDRALGESIGLQTAQAMINARADDGYADTFAYTPGASPGDWQKTDLNEAATPHWGRVTPFGLARGDQFRPALPGGATTMNGLLGSQEYADNVNEVKQVGRADAPASVRTTDQTTLAHFWANDLDNTYKPPGQLFEHTLIVTKAKSDLGTFQTSQLFALVALAMGDAGIAAWDAKYETAVDLWRPETAIKNAHLDSRPDTEPEATWKPESKRTTGASFSPNFPAYVSGHATFAGAWAGVMKRYLGDTFAWTATTNDPFTPGVTRTFTSFSAAATENALSRVYLGVHYRFDGTNGVTTGDQVANHIYTNYLR